MESSGPPGGGPEGQTPSSSGAPTWRSEPEAPAAGTRPGGTWASAPAATGPSAGPAGYYYGDVPNRIIAFIIDAVVFIVIFIILAVVGVAVGVIRPEAGGTAALTGSGDLFVAIIYIVVSAAYFIWSWVSLRGSPGMRVLGLQVGNETDGATLTWGQAATRWALLFGPGAVGQLVSIVNVGLGGLINVLAFIWLIVLLVTIARSPTKQGLHDQYAHTVVVKAGRAAA
jgi:uncharacterized RDD family membrane protein YckC